MCHLFPRVFPRRQTTELATNSGDMRIFSSYIPRQDDCTDSGTSFNSVVAQSLQMYLCNMATCELQNLPLLIKEKGK